MEAHFPSVRLLHDPGRVACWMCKDKALNEFRVVHSKWQLCLTLFTAANIGRTATVLSSRLSALLSFFTSSLVHADLFCSLHVCLFWWVFSSSVWGCVVCSTTWWETVGLVVLSVVIMDERGKEGQCRQKCICGATQHQFEDENMANATTISVVNCFNSGGIYLLCIFSSGTYWRKQAHLPKDETLKQMIKKHRQYNTLWKKKK